MLAILDYGAGNQTSVQRAFAHLGIQAVITADPVILEQSRGIIFPGVGAAGQAMGRLAETGMDKQLKKLAAMHKPLLGVCLGCQILLDSSEEDNTMTLGILRGACRRFDAALKEEDGTPIRIPHMGWNGLIRKKPTPLLRDIPENAEFYFVHSYYANPEPDLVLATSKYGQEFCAIYGYDGLWAVQFHPEKSGAAGLTLLNNFYTYCMECHNAVQTPDRLS